MLPQGPLLALAPGQRPEPLRVPPQARGLVPEPLLALPPERVLLRVPQLVD